LRVLFEGLAPLKDERSRSAVQVTERLAEGAATEDEVGQAGSEANVWNKEFADPEATDAETDTADTACGTACYAEEANSAAVSSSNCAARALAYDG
jgi:hypothetical protein